MLDSLQYFILAIIRIIFGQVVAHVIKKVCPFISERITKEEFFNTFLKDYKIDVKYSSILIVFYTILFYFYGIHLASILALFLVPILLIVFSVDYQENLIPDTAHILIFLLGIIKLCIEKNTWQDQLLGLLIGGGSFLAIAGIAYLFLKKEGMGFGDVKLMAGLGFFFGVEKILVIIIASFIIGATAAIILLLTKKRGREDYIPFGPFIVIGTFVAILIPSSWLIEGYIAFCTFLGRGITDGIYHIISKLKQ